LTLTMALGLALTGEPGATPRPPPISAADWSVWRRHLKEGNRRPAEVVDFAAERVELDLLPRQVTVSGSYTLRNRGAASASLTIAYPILVSAENPPPERILLDGRPLPVRRLDRRRALASFPISVPPRGLARFRIRYVQRHSGRRAAYRVTSARRWPAPIDRAVFVVRHPRRMGRVRLSLGPARTRREGQTVVHTVVRHGFWPDRELEARW
jgi:hypothetical protein